MIILRFCIIFANIYILSNNNNDYNYKWSGGFKINTMHCLFVMFVIFSEFQMVRNNKLTLILKVVQCLTAIKHGFKQKLVCVQRYMDDCLSCWLELISRLHKQMYNCQLLDATQLKTLLKTPKNSCPSLSVPHSCMDPCACSS